MNSSLDKAKLAEMVRSKRANRGLRAIADEINISASTLSRIELGNAPDIDTYFTLCKWLSVKPDFFSTIPLEEPSPAEVIEAYLRADKNLPDELAESFIKMIRFAYNSIHYTTTNGATVAK